MLSRIRLPHISRSENVRRLTSSSYIFSPWHKHTNSNVYTQNNNHAVLIIESKNIKCISNTITRVLSTAGKSGSNDDRNNSDKFDDKTTSDPFGVKYDDGETNLGPESELPPQYVRDPVTGKLTGEIKGELSEEEKKILSMGEDEKQALMLERVMETWKKDQNEEGKTKEDEIARLIRREKMRLNTVGRKVSDLPKPKAIDNSFLEDDDSDTTAESAPLSTSEFDSFQAFLDKHHKTSITNDDILTTESSISPATTRGFDPDQDLSWIHSVNGASQTSEDAWMEDIVPSDLAPPRKLNRREAKPIPKQLLHHNNLALLRRYVTPGGQILNRVQSRLGAKDQRKIAKLVKRARALGLIPHIGQWKYEDHGDLYADDIDEDRDWEKELKERGWTIEHKLEDYEKDEIL